MIGYIVGGAFVAFAAAGVRIVRPTERAVIEFLGKYQRNANSGFNWIIPVVQRLISVNVTEQMVDAKKQNIITKDNLNAVVVAAVSILIMLMGFYVTTFGDKKKDEEDLKRSNKKAKELLDKGVTWVKGFIEKEKLRKEKRECYEGEPGLRKEDYK